MSLPRSLLCTSLVLAAACGHSQPAKAPLGPPPALPELRKVTRPAPQPDHFWEPIEPALRGAARPLELPMAEASITRVEGATRVWDQLGEAGRARARRDGLVVVGADVLAPSSQIGAFYTQLREQRVPYVVTLDALSFALHASFQRALAEVDETVIAPGLRALLAMLEARLGAEQKGAGVEVGEGLRLARGVVAVANVLSREGGAIVPPDLAQIVAQEVALVEAHAGVATSPLLRTPIDYATLEPPRGAADPRAFRAMGWLASAPLLLVGRSEAAGSKVEVSTARTHTRAAMIFARALDREIDPAIHEAWKRLARLLAFLWGPPDDLSPSELAEIAAAADVRAVDPKHIADVTKIDRLRRRAAKGRLPKVFDGAGAPGAGGLSVRLFGGHAPPDSVALGSFAAATKTLPSTLDVAAFLGAKEGRAARSESGAELGPDYEAALTQAIAGRPPIDAPSRHSSVYGSLFDVVMTWLTGDPEGRRTIGSPAAHRAAIDSALSMWTFARHDGRPLTRPRAPKEGDPKEIAALGAPLPAFVEAAPDVIARLVAAAAQMRRGLLALRALPPSSPSLTMLAEVEDVLRISLRIATALTNDEALPAEDVTALAALPARLVRIEGGTTVASTADVIVDRARGAVLVTATSVVEPVVMIVLEGGADEKSGSGKPKAFLVAGAHIAHHEVREVRAGRHEAEALTPNDANGAQLLPRMPYTTVFRMVR